MPAVCGADKGGILRKRVPYFACIPETLPISRRAIAKKQTPLRGKRKKGKNKQQKQNIMPTMRYVLTVPGLRFGVRAPAFSCGLGNFWGTLLLTAGADRAQSVFPWIRPKEQVCDFSFVKG